MARHIITLVFTTLALACLLQTTSAFDLAEYIQGKLQQTIEKEHITCSTYEEFCQKSNKEFETIDKPADAEVNKMAVDFCKAILRIHVCDVDLDKEGASNEE